MNVHTAAAWVAALFLASSVFGHTVALRLVLLAAGIVLASVVVARKRNEVQAIPPIWLPFLLWGAWALLSLAWSLEPERTVKEWKNEVFYTGAALWICFVGAQARGAVRIFLPVLGVAGAIACLVALAEFSRGWAQYNAGWHGGPGDHSSALLVLMPGAAMTAWWAVRRKQAWIVIVSIGLAALLFASGYTTLSRALWIAFALQFVVLGTLLLAPTSTASGGQSNFKGRVIAYTLAGAAIAGGGAAVLSVQVEREATGMPRGIEQDARLALWPEVSARIAERPLAGHGFGRGILREALQAEFKALDANLWHAHNLFLEVLLQLGIPGLVLLLVLLGAVVREGWRMTRSSDEAAACGIALIAVVAGMLARNMTDSLLIRQNALLFWGVVGALLAMGSRWRA